MRPHTLPHWTVVRWPLAFALAAGLTLTPPKTSLPSSSSTAAGIVGPQECAECHVEEHGVWQKSAHFEGGKTLSRSAEAKAIASALGVRRIKGEERCTTCHFTMQATGSGRIRASAGVSCESCHGPAEKWLDVHADFGDGAPIALEEAPDHRLARLQTCQEMGMIPPSSLYELGAQCYTCHSIDDRELIEKGGHPTGADFELVAWSQGEVRHNFSRGPQDNLESPRDRRARMYVIGRGLELEFALRALGQGGAPSEAARERATVAWSDMEAIFRRLDTESLSVLQQRMASFDVRTEIPAANLVGDVAELTRKLEGELHERDLSALFELLPKDGAYRGEVVR